LGGEFRGTKLLIRHDHYKVDFAKVAIFEKEPTEEITEDRYKFIKHLSSFQNGITEDGNYYYKGFGSNDSLDYMTKKDILF
jgi:hypothetical protein